MNAINDFLDDVNNARSDSLVYNFSVIDTSSAILAAINDTPNTDFITGNPISEDFEEVAKVTSINATTNFTVADAEDFWEAVRGVFVVVDDDETTISTVASKTNYTISDAISSYTNTLAAKEWVINADVRIITGNAEEISDAQNNSGSEFHAIFDLVEDSYEDRIIIDTGSEGRQVIVGGPGSNTINVGNGDDKVTGGRSSDIINGGAGDDDIEGGAGNDNIDAGADDDDVEGGSGNDIINAGTGNDTVSGDTGNDNITGGAGSDWLYGKEGRDTIYAGTSDTGGGSPIDDNRITGGEDGDDMYASDGADIFLYEGSDRDELIQESATNYNTRDYIHNFNIGDQIEFGMYVDDVQFLINGSANVSSVEAGDLGLSIRYEENANVRSWDGSKTEKATLIYIDIADEQGHFDNVADMHIVLMGEDIGINWDGSAITYGA